MKTVKKIFTLTFILAIAGCENDFHKEFDKQENDIKNPAFYAKVGHNGTKVELTDEEYGEVWWINGDSINIFDDNNNVKYVTDSSGVEAIFNRAADETADITSADKYIGLYPYQAYAERYGNAVSAILPYRQTAKKGTFDPSAFITAGISETTEMGFYNVCGGIRFTIENPDIDSIIFKGNNSEVLAGKITIEFDQNNIPLATADDEINSIVFTAENGFDNDHSSYYYITMIPQSLDNGFTMDFYKDGELVSSSVCGIKIDINRGAFVTIKNADDAETVGLLMDGEDLTINDETANCYIVSKAGTFKFPAVRGNSNKTLNVARAAVIWETDNTSSAVAEKSIIEKCSYRNSYIHFATPEKLKNGNALIAAYDNADDIIWSWHIWICEDYDPAATAQLYTADAEYAKKTAKMMDRNIGALSAGRLDPLSNGMFYQWGRKDPFLGAATCNGDILMKSTGEWNTIPADTDTGSENYCIKHPTTYLTTNATPNDWRYSSRNNNLWSAKKTEYDPCPAGWKVPQNEVSAESSPWVGTIHGVLNQSIGYFKLEESDESAWYPSNGYLKNRDGGITMNGKNSFYWSTTTDSQYIFAMYLFTDTDKPTDIKLLPRAQGKNRAEGHSVRCIEDN